MSNPYSTYLLNSYQNNKKVWAYVGLGLLGVLIIWIVWRKVFAKRPQDSIDGFNDPKDGINNSGTSKKEPFIGGKINLAYFPTIKEVYNFLSKDGSIDATDAAHEIAYAIQQNEKDYNVNGCESSIADLCAQLSNLMQQNDDFIRAVNREYKRIYKNYIHEDLPSFYNFLTCKCDNNDAYKSKLSSLT